jgi:hypothetical protein
MFMQFVLHRTLPGFLSPPPLDYNLTMLDRRLPPPFMLQCLCLALTLPPVLSPAFAQKPPPSGRILLMPRTMVSGDRATLAVLDVNGRLASGATVVFSNGDRLTTDATGRAFFVAPLNPGVMFASIVGREGRVPSRFCRPTKQLVTGTQ